MPNSGTIPTTTNVSASTGNTPPASTRAKHLRDLNRLRTQTGTDWRPFDGPLTAPTSSTSAHDHSLFTDELGITWNNTSVTSAAPLTHPGAVSTYRLYPGGQAYSIPTLGSSLQNTTLGPDPVTNPLGVYYRLGNVNVWDHVTIQGTVIVHGTDSTPDIEVYGQNVRFRSVRLPVVDGETVGAELPVFIVKDDFRVYDCASGSLEGFTATWGEFGFPAGGQATQFLVTGRVVASEFYAQSRTEWDQSDDWWWNRHEEFLAQLPNSDAILDFLQWLASTQDLDPEPNIVIKPPAASTKFHWPTWSSSAFVAHPSDGGLRWELIRLRESP